ncbi:MAG: hypothetical protein U0586_16280, partial [Candidatus Brocadiaceae bacterium]
SRNQFSFMKAGRLLRKRPLAMTQTMRFDGTLHVVIVHCSLSLQRVTGHCDLILSLRAKRSNLSPINKQYLLTKG